MIFYCLGSIFILSGLLETSELAPISIMGIWGYLCRLLRAEKPV
jgi:hypothetical protein